MKTLLKRVATVTKGSNGFVTDTTTGIEMRLSQPKELGGAGHDGTDPEELFAIGYAACFIGSMEFLLKRDRVKYEDLSVHIENQLMMDEKDGMYFNVSIDARIIGIDQDTETKYIEKAYLFCPFSKAVKGNVNVAFVRHD